MTEPPSPSTPKRKDAYDYSNTTWEQDRDAALEVERRLLKRLDELKKDKVADEESKESKGDTKEDEAARVLQRRYSSYRQRREAQGMNLTASARWTEGMRDRKLSNAGKEQKENKNDTKSRWSRTEVYTKKISEGSRNKDEAAPDPSIEDEMKLGRNEKEREKIKQESQSSKTMESKYFLEIVDSKHRYATNLAWYHKKWNESDSDMNFFAWLDEGPGKDIDLEECPRSRLEKERICYLNAEQRQNFLVVVDDDGLLRWKRSGKPLNTTKFHKNAGPDVGIVEISKEEVAEKEAQQKERRRRARAAGRDISSSSSSSSSSDQEADVVEGAQPYGDKGGTAGQGKGLHQFKARVDYYTSPRAVMDRLLRSTLQKNTWLFVSDLSGNIYVGIKQTGAFQHSSLLFGARVMAAGLIKADDGHLTSLSPLSGHYRAGTMHFRAFVRSLEERGVDMSRVSISKSVITIRGIEKYGAAMKKKSAVVGAIKGAFTRRKSESEDEKEQDEKDVQAVKEKHAEKGDTPGDPAEQRQKAAARLFDQPLPGDGKKHEELSEDERMERALALVQRAFERGLLISAQEEPSPDDTSKDKSSKDESSN